MTRTSGLRRWHWVALVALATGALAIGAMRARPDGSAGDATPGAPAPRFALLDHDGLPFERERLEGRWSLIFFGFTECPDVCPITLQLAHAAREELARTSATAFPQLIFVSLDPEQDTPAVVKSYVRRFDASFLGVTGAGAEVARLEDWLASAHWRGRTDTSGSARIDHGAYLYVIDPQARASGRIEGIGQPSALAERIRTAVSSAPGRS